MPNPESFSLSRPLSLFALLLNCERFALVALKKKSDCERFAQVAHDKRAIISESLLISKKRASDPDRDSLPSLFTQSLSFKERLDIFTLSAHPRRSLRYLQKSNHEQFAMPSQSKYTVSILCRQLYSVFEPLQNVACK